MKRRLLSITLILTMLLTGCGGKSISCTKESPEEVTQATTVSVTTGNDGEITLSEISEKYAAVSSSKMVEPLYNVAQD